MSGLFRALSSGRKPLTEIEKERDSAGRWAVATTHQVLQAEFCSGASSPIRPLSLTFATAASGQVHGWQCLWHDHGSQGSESGHGFLVARRRGTRGHLAVSPRARLTIILTTPVCLLTACGGSGAPTRADRAEAVDKCAVVIDATALGVQSCQCAVDKYVAGGGNLSNWDHELNEINGGLSQSDALGSKVWSECDLPPPDHNS
jgi:hypothetical protein